MLQTEADRWSCCHRLSSQPPELQSCFFFLRWGRREGWDNRISDDDWLSNVEWEFLSQSVAMFSLIQVIREWPAEDMNHVRAATHVHERDSRSRWFKWQRERDSCPQEVVCERGTSGRESRLCCHSLMIRIAEDVVLIHVLCWKWRCVSQSLTQGRGVDSRSVTVLLKLALCC